MKKARFTEEQIIGFLREQESGMTTADGNFRVRLVELRRALDGPGRCETYIANVNGHGYCFVGNMEVSLRL
jgi:DNA-binding winged helix-turn-helix (wHTH) protein